MKRYKFEIIITEGNDEFWENINEHCSDSGVAEVTRCVTEVMEMSGWAAEDGCEIKLKEFRCSNEDEQKIVSDLIDEHFVSADEKLIALLTGLEANPALAKQSCEFLVKLGTAIAKQAKQNERN